jgi:ankyrin repeat protein
MLLLERGADVNAGYEPLLRKMIFCREPIQAMIPYILSRGAETERCDEWLQTFLHYTARDGNERVARWLIEAGANLEARTEGGGLTPLHYAVIRGRQKTVTLLLERGRPGRVQINTRTSRCIPPLHKPSKPMSVVVTATVMVIPSTY